MTGYTVHTGASKKFVKGWDRIFSDESDAPGKAKSASGKKKKKTAAKKK